MFDLPIFPIIGRYSGVPSRKNPFQPTLATPIQRPYFRIHMCVLRNSTYEGIQDGW